MLLNENDIRGELRLSFCNAEPSPHVCHTTTAKIKSRNAAILAQPRGQPPGAYCLLDALCSPIAWCRQATGASGLGSLSESILKSQKSSGRAPRQDRRTGLPECAAQ